MQKYLPVSQVVMAKAQLFDYNPQVLSLIGDGVHTLFVRTKLSFSQPYQLGDLHNKVSRIVCAKAQAIAVQKLVPLLNEDELFIYRKCKNAKSNNIPKHASVMEYKYATALEGIIGFLYLSRQNDRLEELFAALYNDNL